MIAVLNLATLKLPNSTSTIGDCTIRENQLAKSLSMKHSKRNSSLEKQCILFDDQQSKNSDLHKTQVPQNFCI